MSILHPDDIPELNDVTKRIIKDRKTLTRTYRLKHKDSGDYLWFEDRVMPILDEKGEITGIQGLARDITDRRKNAEEKERLIRDIQSTVRKLSASQKEWHDTFDAIQDIIYITDNKYTLLKVNWAFARYFGKTPQEVINRKCYAFFHSQTCPVSNCPHTVTLISNKMETSEIVEPLKNRLFKITSFPYYSHEGDFVGSIYIARDITEEREKEMKNILNERLASLGQMSAAIAHEINNPLASITACAEGLLKRLKTGKIDQELFDSYLNIIEEESFRCKKITENMLSSVRVDKSGKEKVDIHAMLDRSLELVGLQNRLANVDVTKDFAETLPAIKGNELELSQVFSSIISNALDAMNDVGSIILATQIEESSVVVLINDTGSGIPKDHANKIFEPFFTTKARSGGTGLGLSIANQIIRSHGGEIEVLSGKDKGAAIKISLPVEPAH